MGGQRWNNRGMTQGAWLFPHGSCCPLTEWPGPSRRRRCLLRCCDNINCNACWTCCGLGIGHFPPRDGLGAHASPTCLTTIVSSSASVVSISLLASPFPSSSPFLAPRLLPTLCGSPTFAGRRHNRAPPRQPSTHVTHDARDTSQVRSLFGSTPSPETHDAVYRVI